MSRQRYTHSRQLFLLMAISLVSLMALNGLVYLAVIRVTAGEAPAVAVYLGTTAGGILVVALTLLFAGRLIVKPVQNLQMQLQNLQDHMVDGGRIEVARHDAVGEIADSINTLMLHGETAARESLQAHALVEQIIKSADIGIVALNHRGHIVVINQSLEDMLGVSRDEIEKRGWFETMYRDEDERARARQKWHTQLGQYQSVTEEWQIDAGRGEKKALAVVVVPLRKPEGEAIGTISFCHDLSTQRSLEAQVEQSRRLAGLGTIAGGIAHNFNNILCAILGYTTLGRERAARDDPIREYFTIIEQSATRASQLTQQLLMFSKGGQTTMQLVDLRPIIHEVVSLLRESFPRSIVIEEIYHHDWLFLKADSAQLHQCLMNICLNARDAMPNGGRLSIDSTVQNYDAASLPFAELTPGRFIRLEIKDNGSGMSDDVKQRVFEPFFTTKSPGKGTGLGLATVYGSIKSHRGHIEVNSELERGTTFTIYLPALKDLFADDPLHFPPTIHQPPVTVVKPFTAEPAAEPAGQGESDDAQIDKPRGINEAWHIDEA